MRAAIAFVLLFLTGSTAAAEVVAGVHVIRGHFTPGAQPDGNTVILDAPEGLIVIDSGRHVAHTRQILDFARTAGRPIRAVVNTHWHLDHVGGNVLIRREHPAVRVYASDAIRKAMTGFLANYRKQLMEMISSTKDAEQKKSFETEVQLIDSGAALAPDVVIARSGRMSIAGRELMIGLETNAVTSGDVWVLDERTGVLIAGDLVTLPAPFLDTACPSRWGETLDRVATRTFDLLVPGHGAPMTRTQFETYRIAFASLLECTSGEADDKECSDAWIAAIRPLTAALDETFTQALMGYYVKLLRDASKLDVHCRN
jgi:glyoxylase-like metal-dependent hydrolase (beta-lactamase superfamily II)